MDCPTDDADIPETSELKQVVDEIRFTKVPAEVALTLDI